METKLLNIKGQEIGKQDLPGSIFSVKADPHFLHEAVRYYLSNKHRGTASTKTRGEVSGGGKKPWKQKGTGRARSGSNRSPVWRKGGIVFGPRPHSYRRDMPTAKRRQFLIEALSARCAEGAVVVMDNFDLQDAKTKSLRDAWKSLQASKTLFVMDKPDRNFIGAGRNIEGFGWAVVSNLNAYQVLNGGTLVFSAAALKALEKNLGEGK